MSKKTHVIVKLTQLEAEMLEGVAGDGWGDGDFADWLGVPEEAQACKRAMGKLSVAIREYSTRALTTEE